jgi:Glycosyl hydrolase family 1
VKDIYITENGCSATDVPAADGIVYDTDRIMFLRNYLTHLQRATAEHRRPSAAVLHAKNADAEHRLCFAPRRA